MWQAVLEVKEKTAAPLTLLDILRPGEYQNIISDQRFKSQLLSEDDIAKKTAVDFERARPLAGDELFRLVFLYKAVRLRICLVLTQSVKEGHVTPWFQDDGLKQQLGLLLSAQEMKLFEAEDSPQLQWVMNILEQKILTQIRQVITED
jgi:hypothetical protein